MSNLPINRRNMIKASAGAAALAAVAPSAYAKQTETLKVGLIGAGNRGTGAAVDIAKSSPGIEIVALADLYDSHLKTSSETIKKYVPDSYKVTDKTMFTGLDAYKKLIAMDEIDIVLCAGYPQFRPQHVEAAVAAGKHVFAEKPIAVDPVGVRRFMKAGEAAAKAGLGILAGTQRRHAPHYQQAVAAVQDGLIGKVSSGSLFFCRAAGRVPVARKEGESDMDWMFRNWWWFSWLSGGMIGQLVIHQIDTMHWIMGGPCKMAYGFGGREVYKQPLYGNIFDHFTVMYEYPGGEQFHAYTRQTPGTDGNMGGIFLGNKGRLANASTRCVVAGYDNKLIKMFKKGRVRPFVQEHEDFVASIRKGKPLNESKNVGESTLMAIMGTVSAWTGKKVTFDYMMNKSQMDLTPKSYTEGDIPPVPIPGVTKLV